MKYLAKFIKQEFELENIFIVEINGQTLEVFVPNLFHLINYEIYYKVDIEAIVLDEYIIEKSQEQPILRKLGNSLKYEIIGLLTNGSIQVNEWIFEDEFLKNEFYYLDQKSVKWTVDRFNLYFEERDFNH